MKRLVTRLAAGAALALALGAAPALAQMPDVPLGKWWKRPRVVEMLRLSPEQQERLEELFQKKRREFVDLRADVERRQIDTEELLARRDSDPKRVAAAVDALEQSKSRLRKATLMMVVEMRQVLTAAQWQTIVEQREQWRRERMEGRRRRGPGGDGEGSDWDTAPRGRGRRMPQSSVPPPPPQSPQE